MKRYECYGRTQRKRPGGPIPNWRSVNDLRTRILRAIRQHKDELLYPRQASRGALS